MLGHKQYILNIDKWMSFHEKLYIPGKMSLRVLMYSFFTESAKIGTCNKKPVLNLGKPLNIKGYCR